MVSISPGFECHALLSALSCYHTGWEIEQLNEQAI